MRTKPSQTLDVYNITYEMSARFISSISCLIIREEGMGMEGYGNGMELLTLGMGGMRVDNRLDK